MAFSEKNKQNLSIEDKLKATDKYIAKMKGILATMDEIAQIKRAKGDTTADSDVVGGYKRSSIVKLISELEKQREQLISELDENTRKAIQERDAKLKAQEDELKAKNAQLKAKDDELKAQKDAIALRDRELPNRNDNVVTSFKKGDNALAIEGLYTGLSMDIEKLRDDILQEMKYSYKQDIAIYDDLSEKIDAIKAVDASALEEGLKPLQAMEEKLNALQVIDYDVLAEKMNSKLAEGKIDYDILAEKVATVMTVYAESMILPKTQLNSIEQRLEEMQHTLSGIMNVKQMPEFRKLDLLIEEYLRTLSYENIPDLLILANEIRITANRHIAGGNALRGEGMLADLGIRLKSVVMSGYNALVVVEDAIKTHSLPQVLSAETFAEFKDACGELERSPAVCSDEIINRVVRAKKALFNDIEASQFDNETMQELLEILAEVPEGEIPAESTITNIVALKKEIMNFNLYYFVDLVPVIAEPEKSAPVDTQAILNAIAGIKLPEVVTAYAPAPETNEVENQTENQAVAESAIAAAPEMTLAEAKQAVPAVRVKKQKIMRPGVSSKDNKMEKTNQPLRTVRRSLKTTDDNPNALSKALVGQVAQKIANSMIK